MDIRDLKVFQMIAVEKSVSKAAKKLYMTPQGVSKILKNLETEMGSQLFVRDKNGMHLTESGERFLVYANQDIEDYYEMKREILHIEQRQRKVVDLLSAYGILRLVTPDCINAFEREHPDIEFQYREYPDLPVEQLFEEKEGNVAFSIGDFDEEKYHIVGAAPDDGSSPDRKVAQRQCVAHLFALRQGSAHLRNEVQGQAGDKPLPPRTGACQGQARL